VKLSKFLVKFDFVGPSNKAVTTLRYTPDKPYKLQISSVNSEVEIFGVTTDLYYIRHGKNYGFLPKNHLREKARGNYPFSVELDLSNRRIDQQVREQNFLHEFLKTSQQAQVQEVNVTETIKNEAQPAPVNEPSQENVEEVPQAVQEAPKEAQEVPRDSPFDEPSDTKQNELPAASDEAENDSGIDEDEDDEEEDDEEEEEESNEVLDKKEKKEEVEQPELIAIPPNRDTENVREEEPKAFPVPAAKVEEISQIPDESLNATVQEQPKPVEEVPEFIPIKNEAVVEAESHLPSLNETEKVEEKIEAKVDEVPEVKVEEIVTQPTVIVEELNNMQNDTKLDEQPTTLQEPEKKIEDQKLPEPVAENIPELTTLPPQHVEVPDIPIETEVTAPQFEATTEEPKVEKQTETPEIITEAPTLFPDIPEVTQPPQEEVTDPTALPLQPKKLEPDALLKKFNEKLGNRIVEGTGKGSIEPLHKPEDHHGHEHEHHIHHEEKPETPPPQELPQIKEEEEDKPGFFSGLFKKFFSDEDDSEQHFHEPTKHESVLTKTIDKSGEFLFFSRSKVIKVRDCDVIGPLCVACQSLF
jgi:hypothetical protein